MLTLFLVGHRGTGKTEFSKTFDPVDWEVFDLDSVIIKVTGNSIEEIFATKGEKFFRNLEREILENLLSRKENNFKNRVYVLGAGFERLDLLKKKIWH